MKSTAFAATVALTLPLLATTSVTALAVTTDEFVNKAAISDMFEIESGKLAQDKAKDEDVKDFGEQMVDDHTETSEDLKSLVKDEKIDVKIPTKMDERHQEQLDKLKKLSGAEFDRAYVPTQVLAHEQAVNLFEDYSETGDNEALKEWASDTLPTLKDHLEEARELNEELSAPAKTAAADNDDAADHDKSMDRKSMDHDKTMMDKATDETDVDGTDNVAVNEKADNKTAKNADRAADRKAAPSFEYVTQQSPTDWTAQNLIGKQVENKNGEELGEVNNVIVNEKGKVVAITVGVGGFLGLGEKDVGVPFEALTFRDEDAVDQNEDGDDTADTNATDGDRDDQVIVIDATKEQLEDAPDFVWLGEKRDKRAEAGDNDDSLFE